MKKTDSKIQIEQIVSVEQLKECVEIFIEAYSDEPWCENWLPNTVEALFENCFYTPGFMGWIATSSDNIVGCCIGNTEPYYTGRTFWIRDIFISTKSQKMGIGNKLIAIMKSTLERDDISRVVLFTHQTISGFYTQSDFSEIAGMRMMDCTINEVFS